MKIIVNADDFGMSHDKNIAVDEMMKRNICTNASLVVNMPDTWEAVELAKIGGYTDRISLHLNLTVGESLTQEIRKNKLYYDNGKFAYRPIIKSNQQIYPLYIRIIRKEIEAQIERFLELGLQIKCIDSHNWVHLRLPVWLALKPLLTKYNIQIVRPMWCGYKRPEIASKKWSKYFRIIEPYILKNPRCKVIGHTSNIEQFFVDQDLVNNCKYVEVFTHPDIIEDKIIDLSSSYLGKPKENVIDNVALLNGYEMTVVSKILEEIEK